MQFEIPRKEYNFENSIVRCGNSSVATCGGIETHTEPTPIDSCAQVHHGLGARVQRLKPPSYVCLEFRMPMRFRWLAASEKRMNGNFPLYFSLGITWNEIQPVQTVFQSAVALAAAIWDDF